MSKRTNWDKIATQQFRSMPKSFQKDWADLRQTVYHHA
jgi:hypothetical protein